jgi:putative tryptophan/tyrosine transport system substrate-binding protein
MRRRDFITALGAAAFIAPQPGRAQSAAMPVIGFLNSASPVTYARPLQAFHRGLEEAGYIEGKNVAIEYRLAESRYDRLPAMATDLVQRQVTVIVATTGSAALAAKAATTTIPVVFETGGDPLRLGLVASLSRPGGNVTGISQLTTGLAPKDLEILHELLPAARVMALLVNPTNSAFAETVASDVRAAARTLGLEILVLNASSDGDFDGVFAALGRSGAGGLVIGGDSFFSTRLDELAALALRHGVSAIFIRREFAAAGGLLSYGNDVADTYRQVGIYTGRILKGEKPADPPVQQATKVELVINLKTVNALGLSVPTTLLARADEVIE